MSKKKWSMYGAIVAAIVVAVFAVPSLAGEPSYEDLQARLDVAEAKLATLGTEEPSWLDARRTEEMQALVNDVLADAETRTMMQGDGKSPVTVNLHGFAITRWQYNNDGGVSENNEFSIPYARLEVSGEILGKVGYYVSGEFSDYNNGEFELVDAYLTLGLGADFDLQVGQFVTAFYNGYTDSPLDQVAGEYSVLATTFGQGRSQGLEVSRDFDFVKLSASYNDGFDSNNSFIDNDDYGVSVRADFDFGAGFHAGAAYAYQSELVDYGTYTLDLGYTNGAWDLGVSWVSADYETGGYGENYGLNALVAYQCTDNLQGFVQYQNGKLGVADNDLNILEVGANVFVNDYVRWTTTVGYAFDGVDAGWDLGRSGWNTGDSDGQYLVSTQLSVAF